MLDLRILIPFSAGNPAEMSSAAFILTANTTYPLCHGKFGTTPRKKYLTSPRSPRCDLYFPEAIWVIH
jgi:hypothetical protein